MEIDWSGLQRLRSRFLEGTAGRSDYWQSVHDLFQYDLTFAQRIGWKWDFVLDDLRQLGWKPPEGTLLDWACGSGVASRAVLDHFGADAFSCLNLWDRSGIARDFAAGRAREKFPGLAVITGQTARSDLLLVSHVINELSATDIEELLALAESATSIIWVEPGTYDSSRALIAVRERLRSRFHVVAPCPHQNRCGVLQSGNECHWCHQFARPPEHVFVDPFWARFSKELGIDLRSLPLSYLALDRRIAPALPPQTVRLLGRPEIFKHLVRMMACTPTGVVTGELSRRRHPAGYRILKKGRQSSLQLWERESMEIDAWRPLRDQP